MYLNSATTLEITIFSEINETFNNIVYIIIDGGSKDNSLYIIKIYEIDFQENYIG